MMVSNEYLKIIRTIPGKSTGDTYIQTEDGQWWEPVPFKSCKITGKRYGTKINGYIKLKS